jgi:hypothetical protein
MPGATADGLPYPLGTEPVRDGDNAIKNLADALQARGHGLRTIAGRFDGTTDGNGYVRVSAPWLPRSCVVTGVVPADRLYVIDATDAAGALVRIYTVFPYAVAVNTATAFYYWIVG